MIAIESSVEPDTVQVAPEIPNEAGKDTTIIVEEVFRAVITNDSKVG